MKTTVANQIIKILESANVKRIYGLIGDSLNPFGQAVSKSSLQWIAVRHEEVAAFAAAGEAFFTNQLAVCAGTCGPGSIHLINGLYEANRNHVPVLAIVTHIPSLEIGLHFFQETHPLSVFKDCSLFCEMLSHPSQMPRLVQEAIQTALSKSGVAVIVVPGDIAQEPCPDSAFFHPPVIQNVFLTPDKEKIQEAFTILNTHQKITLYVGEGAKNAMPEVMNLAKILQSPIIYTIRSKEFVEADNPYAVGMMGYLSWGSSQKAIQDCDCLMLLGTDFPYENLLPKNVPIIQIDKNGSHLGRRSRLDLGIIGDLKLTLPSLIKGLKPKSGTFLKKCVDFSKKTTNQLEKEAESFSNSKTLRPEYLTQCISKMAPKNTIFLIDVGLNDMWASRYLKAQKGRRIVGSFKHGTMAAAIGEAIGIAFTKPNTPIVVLAGDGGLGMLLGDLLTVLQYNLPILIFVYNNQELGFINFEALMEGYKPFGTELKNPDFSKIAEAIGLKGYSLKTAQEVIPVLEKAFLSNIPTLVNAWTDRKAIGFIGNR